MAAQEEATERPEDGTQGLEAIKGAAGIRAATAAAAKPVPQSIFIVDDNVDAAESLGALLRLFGHSVAITHDSLKALEVIASFKPTIGILDIGMPGVDGYELARTIRRRHATEDLLLIALTGYGREDDKRHGLECGFDHYMVKPCDPAALRRIVEQRGQPG